jgi:flagellar protein FliS
MTHSNRAINAYVKTEIESALPEASPHRLVQMLFDGAIAAVVEARIRLAGGDIPGRGQAISKAISIVEGLRSSLDHEKGGQIAERLGALYEYIESRLLHANLKSDGAALDESIKLLSELQGAWKAIGEQQREAAPAAARV